MKNKTIEELEKIGTGDALCEIGLRYQKGKDVSKDYNKAFEYYRKSYNMGSIEGSYQFAKSYYFGRGVEIDDKKALEIFEKLVKEYNHINSKYSAAEIYYYGCELIEKDYEKAFKYFKEVVDENNDKDAISFLADMYYYGKGTEINYEKAKKYAELAEKKGDKYVLYILGEMYLYGRGVEIDKEKAVMYFEKNLDIKYDDVYYKLATLYLEDFNTEENILKAQTYLNKIQEDLLKSVIYFLLAVKPIEEQNINAVKEILKYERGYLREITNLLPKEHISLEHHKRLRCLRKDEYNHIQQMLMQKLEKYINDNNFDNSFANKFDCVEDVDLYVNNFLNNE